MNITGVWFDGKTSQQLEVLATLDAARQLTVRRTDSNALVVTEAFADLRFSSRIGNTPRSVYFASGGELKTKDNKTIDEWLEHFHPSMGSKVIHVLESRWRYVLLSLVAVIFVTWASVVYGVPAVSKWIAKVLPDQVAIMASQQALKTLDELFFEESELSEEHQNQLRNYFQTAQLDHKNYQFTVLFRQGGPLGANAFALPDGTIVFTDQMVNLAEDDDELLAIFFHEVGHVVHQHGMRSMVQSSLLGFLVIAMTGDVGATAEILLFLPAFLSEMSYSRQFEREADGYALDYMRQQGIATEHFVNIMQRLEKFARCYEPVEKTDQDQSESEKEVVELDLNNCPAAENGEENNWSKYLSTHPPTDERLQPFMTE